MTTTEQHEAKWSYFTWLAKVPSISRLDNIFNLLGADGWELVASATTVKSQLNLTGNDLIFVFKKQGENKEVPSNIMSLMAKYRGISDTSAEPETNPYIPKYDGTW